jgi:purine-binding chemotaxis protein CheW
MDVAGHVFPVLNLRQRFGLPNREIDPEHQFLIAHTASRVVALVVDEVQDVIALRETAVTDARRIIPGLGHIHGVITLDDGLVIIQDLEQCLSLPEERELDAAMQTTMRATMQATRTMDAAHGT